MTAYFTRLLLLFATALLFALPKDASGQITADSIAAQISAESGNPADNYRDYGEKLAKVLYGLSPAARERVLGTPASVLLNDTLGLDPFNFASLSAALNDQVKDQLDKVAKFLQKNPDQNILIEGHTAQNFGGSMKLSEDRARAAKEYLSSLGIDPTRVETQGFGNSQPIVDGKNQAENRRIDIKLQ